MVTILRPNRFLRPSRRWPKGRKRPKAWSVDLPVLCATLLLVVTACRPASGPTSALVTEPAAATPPAELSTSTTSALQRPTGASEALTLEDFARQLVEQLRDRRIERLAQAVHPELGLRFVPYATLDQRNVILSAAELVSAWQDPRPLRWGSYDGSGEPIELSLRAYFEEFVYDVDFLKAQFAANRRLGQGNSIDNIEQVYPSAQFVEFHHPGSEPYGGMDWLSLRLVLAPKPNGGWWLLALVHDQWTI